MAITIKAPNLQAQLVAYAGDTGSATGRLIQYNVKAAQLAAFQKAVKEYIVYQFGHSSNQRFNISFLKPS